MVYDCYPQLHLHNIGDFKIANDVFAMCKVRLLQGNSLRRLPKEAEDLVKNHGSWCIQFPKFTYIWILGSVVCSKKHPRFPPKEPILMEVVR